MSNILASFAGPSETLENSEINEEQQNQSPANEMLTLSFRTLSGEEVCNLTVNGEKTIQGLCYVVQEKVQIPAEEPNRRKQGHPGPTPESHPGAP